MWPSPVLQTLGVFNSLHARVALGVCRIGLFVVLTYREPPVLDL